MPGAHSEAVHREVVILPIDLLQAGGQHAVNIGILRPVAGHDAVFSIDPLMGVAVKDVIHRGIIVAGCYIIHAADGITGAVEEIRLPFHLAQLVFHHRAGPIVAQAVCGIVPAATEQPAVLAEQITHQGGAQLHLAGHRIVDPIVQGAHVIHVVFGGRYPTGTRRADPHIEQTVFITEQARILRPAGAHAVLAEVVVVTVDLLQAGQGHAVHIVGLAVPALQQDAVGIALAVQLAGEQLAADGALHHAVRQLIAVAGGGNGGAPLHHGAAHLAVGAAGVAVLGAGGRLVGQGHGVHMVGGGFGIVLLGLGPVVMAAVPGSVVGGLGLVGPVMGLGIHLDPRTGEGVGGAVDEGHLAPDHGGADVDGPHLVALAVFGIHPHVRAGAVSHHGGQLPGAHRHGHQHALAGGIGAAGAGDGDGGDLLIGVADDIGGLEARGHGHVVQLPAAHIVQVDVRRHGLYLFHVGRNQVHVVHGAQQDVVHGCVVRHQLHGGQAAAGLHVDLADGGGIVALLVADGELHGVDAVGQHAVAGGQHAALQGAGNGHAVHIDPGSGFIQAGGVALVLVGHGSAEGQHVVIGLGHGATGEGGGIAHLGIRPAEATEHGSVPVVHGVGVIHGDVVQIHHHVAVLGLVLQVVIAVLAAVPVVDVHIQHVPIGRNAPVAAGQVEVHIVPAGLVILHGEAAVPVAAVVDEGGCGVAAGHGLDGAVLVALLDRLQEDAAVERLGLNGEIDPHTQAGGILQVDALAGVVLHVQPGVHIAGLRGHGEVGVELQGIAAAVDLSGLGSGQGAAAGGDEIVIIWRSRAIELGDVAVLEVPQYLGPLAQLDLSGGSHVRSDDRCRDGAFGDAAVTGSEVKAVDGAHTGVAQGKVHILGLDLHLVEAVGSRQVQRHRSPEGHGHAGVDEGQLLGHHRMDGDGAHVPALVLGRQDGVAHGRRGQDAVFIGTVGDGVGDALGDLRRRTGRRHAGRGDLRAGAGGDVLVRRRHAHAVEHVGGSRRGGDDQARGNGPLGAVGGPVDDADGVGALRPGGIGGGAAAVQVDSRHAAGFQHDLGQLVHGAAAGEGLLAAVQHHGHYLAVGGDAHAGAGVAVRVVRTACVGGNVLAVADQPHGTGHRLPDGALAVLVHILAEVAGIVDDRRLAVLQNGEEVVIVVGAEGHTVDIGDAHGLTGGHVVEGGVDACHYVVILADELGIVGVAVLPVGIGHLVGELLHAHDAVLVLLEIGRLHHHVVPGDVRSGHIVDHLLAVLGVGVVDVLLHTGSQGRFRVLEHIVGLGDKLGITAIRRECRARQQAEHHHHGQKQRCQPLGHTFLHFFVSFPLFLWILGLSIVLPITSVLCQTYASTVKP